MYETQQQIQISLPPPTQLFTPGVIILLILLIAGWALFEAAPDFAAGVLAISASGVLHGKVWQLVTYPFAGDLLINIFFNGLMIIFAGSSIEREWRTASFFLLWVVISIMCGLIWVAVNAATGNNFIGFGASGCIYGLIAVMGLLFRDRRFFLFIAVVEAKYLVLILIAIGIVMNISTPINLIWISGTLFGYLYVKLRWSLASRGARRNKVVKQSRCNNFVDID
ncbi:MAG: rhomboid family intramembrane serine protease [Phycisphaerae bacterium]|jgi:membrane associated rhomboid family serine protease